MTYQTLGSHVISVDLPDGQQFTHAIVEALPNAVTIIRAVDVDNTLVFAEHECIRLADHPELIGLYRGGVWDVTKLTQLLLPSEPSTLQLTNMRNYL